MARDSGGLGSPTNSKEPLVFGKFAYRLWIALCIMVGVGIVSSALILLLTFGGN